MQIHTCTAKNNVEVHAVDTNAGVILDAQVNVFLDTKPKVAGVTEVIPPQLILSHLPEK